MKWAALAAWVITAGAGFGLLGMWLARGGLRQSGQPGARIRPPLIFTHFGLAASGLVLWILYVASDADVLAWVAFAVVAVVALLGFAMLAVWLQRRRRTADAGPGVERPAEQHFPAGLVTFHGIVAATTLVTVVLAAAGVGS